MSYAITGMFLLAIVYVLVEPKHNAPAVVTDVSDYLSNVLSLAVSGQFPNKQSTGNTSGGAGGKAMQTR